MPMMENANGSSMRHKEKIPAIADIAPIIERSFMNLLSSICAVDA
jgi:hypothetical protein